MSDGTLRYEDAGVDIDEAHRALDDVSQAIKESYGPRVVGGVGSFGSLFSASFPDMEHPLLVTSIDGVGTKTIVAAMAGDFSGIGTDIVHHCVNDILCQGAQPLLFMDYFGCSRLDPAAFRAVVGGAAVACKRLGVSLVGGETAEMPGVYADGEVDIVGSIVGVVDMNARLPRSKPLPGDVVVGLASSGLHTNGFSLARKALFEHGGLSVRDKMPDGYVTLAEELLRPHTCYYSAVYPLIHEFESIRAVAHITGGGLGENIPRVLPADRRAVIERSSWELLPIFRLIQDVGHIDEAEMFRAFNMGVGMVLVAARELGPVLVDRFAEMGYPAAPIGEIVEGPNDVQFV